MDDILDSIIHAIDSDDLRWCGESPVLVEIAATDLCLLELMPMRFTIFYQNVHDLKPQVFKRGISSIKEAEALVIDFQDACDGAFREAYEYGPTSVWYEPEDMERNEAQRD